MGKIGNVTHFQLFLLTIGCLSLMLPLFTLYHGCLNSRAPDRQTAPILLPVIQAKMPRYRDKSTDADPNASAEWTLVRLHAGLGNQMFQFASATGIAQARKSRLCIIGRFELSALAQAVEFLGAVQNCEDQDRVMYEEESGFATFDQRLMNLRGTVHVATFLQSYKYFDRIPFRLKTEQWAARWVKAKGVTVGIHVRRGENARNQEVGGRVAPPIYFEYCLQLLKVRYGTFRTVVVSDDPDWVEAQPIFVGAIVRRGGSAAEDMAVLTACTHVVASIGTFGWWAMRLKSQPGDCFYYADPWNYTIVPQYRSQFTAADHFLPEWNGVGDAELVEFQRSMTHSS